MTNDIGHSQSPSEIIVLLRGRAKVLNRFSYGYLLFTILSLIVSGYLFYYLPQELSKQDIQINYLEKELTQTITGIASNQAIKQQLEQFVVSNLKQRTVQAALPHTIHSRKVNFQSLRDIFFFGEQHGWITMSDGQILLTENGGHHWKTIQANNRSPLNSIFFLDEKEGWAVGDNSTILRSKDGGHSWNLIREYKDKHDLEFKKVDYEKNLFLRSQCRLDSNRV